MPSNHPHTLSLTSHHHVPPSPSPFNYAKESTGLSAQLKEATEKAAKEKADLDRKLDSAKGYIDRMQVWNVGLLVG